MKKWLLGACIMTFTLVLMCFTAFAEDKSTASASAQQKNVTAIADATPKSDDALKVRLEHMAFVNRVFDDDIFSDDNLIQFASFHLAMQDKSTKSNAEIPADVVKSFVRDFYGLEVEPSSSTVPVPKSYGRDFRLTTRSLEKTEMGYRLNSKIEFLSGDRVMGSTGLITDFRAAPESPYGFTLEYARLTD